MTPVDYYFSVASPWAYLGSGRLLEMRNRYQVRIRVVPIDLSRVFDSTGGLSYPQRSSERRRYRQVDLARWSRVLGIPLALEPAYYPVDRTPASLILIAARERGMDALPLSDAVLAAIWRDEKDIADWATLSGLAAGLGMDADALVEAARSPEIAAAFERDTDASIAAGVFGSPTYVVDGELFWGQDRLDLLDRELARRAA